MSSPSHHHSRVRHAAFRCRERLPCRSIDVRLVRFCRPSRSRVGRLRIRQSAHNKVRYVTRGDATVRSACATPTLCVCPGGAAGDNDVRERGAEGGRRTPPSARQGARDDVSAVGVRAGGGRGRLVGSGGAGKARRGGAAIPMRGGGRRRARRSARIDDGLPPPLRSSVTIDLETILRRKLVLGSGYCLSTLPIPVIRCYG